MGSNGSKETIAALENTIDIIYLIDEKEQDLFDVFKMDYREISFFSGIDKKAYHIIRAITKVESGLAFDLMTYILGGCSLEEYDSIHITEFIMDNCSTVDLFDEHQLEA